MILTSRSRFIPTRLSTVRVWLSGADPANGVLPANGTSIQDIINKGWQSGITCTQNTAANQGTFVANQYNGKGIIRTTGANKIYNISGYTYGSSFTIFGVFTPSATAGYINAPNEIGALISKFTNSVVQNYEFYHLNGTLNRQVLSTSATGMNIVCVSQTDASSLVGYLNGTQVFSVTPTAASNGQTLQYLFGALGTGTYDGDFGTFISCNSFLSTSDRTSITHYLGDNWGVSVA